MTRWWSVCRAFDWCLNFLLLLAVSLLIGLQIVAKMPVEPETDSNFHFFFLFLQKLSLGPNWSNVVGCGWLWKGEREKCQHGFFSPLERLIMSRSGQELKLGVKDEDVTHQDYHERVCFSKWHPLVVGLGCWPVRLTKLVYVTQYTLSGWSTQNVKS